MRMRNSIFNKVSGFTLVEVLAALGILMTFLTATLVSFTAVQKLSENNQQQNVALQAAKAKLEEIRSMDFETLWDWYSQVDAGGDPVNQAFDILDQDGNPLPEFKGNIHIVDRYDDWIQEDDTPDPGNDYWSVGRGCVVFDDKLWLLGGDDCGPKSKIVQNWQEGVGWTRVLPDPPWDARGHHTSVVFAGSSPTDRIWVIGGDCGNWGSPDLHNDVWSTPDGVNWTEETNSAQWSSRRNHASVVFDDKIWVLGGYAEVVGSDPVSYEYKNDIWYSEDGASWTQVTPVGPMWSARYQHAAVVFKNRIYILGGQDASGVRLNDVWSSEDGINWTQETAAAWVDVGGTAYPRRFHAAAVLDNRIWVTGGNTASGSTNDVWFSADGINWEQTPGTIAGTVAWSRRAGHATKSYSNRLWVLSGVPADWDQRFSVWWSYGAERMYEANITVSWRNRNGHIVGEDKNLNGLLDSGEDDDGDGQLDSPCYVRTWLADRGYPAQIYMGRK